MSLRMLMAVAGASALPTYLAGGGPNGAANTPPCNKALALATGQGATIMGTPAAPGVLGTVLSATAGGVALVDGGTYIPGGLITINGVGNGRFGLYATAGTFGSQLCGGQLEALTSSATPATLTAPAAGPLTIVSMRATANAQVTYETLTLQPGDGGGGIPPVGLLMPPPPPTGPQELTDGRYTIRWEPLPDRLAVTVIARVEDGAVPTWIGFARGTVMLPGGRNLALIGEAMGGLSPYYMSGKSAGAMAPLTINAATLCGLVAGGPNAPVVTVDSTALTMTFSLSYAPEGSTCTPDGLATLPTLSVPQGSGAVGTLITSGLAPFPSSHPTGSYLIASALSADGAGTGTIDAGDAAIFWHGLLMTTAWIVLAPIGVAASRYARHLQPEGRWLAIHRGALLLASLFTFIGFFVIYGNEDREGTHFVTTHAKLGLLLFLLSLAQPISGVMRPGKQSPHRALWLLSHRVVGLFLLLLAFFLCWLGASLTTNSGSVLTVIILAQIGVVGALFYVEYRRRQAGSSNCGAYTAAAGARTGDALPAGWSKSIDPTSGKPYYVNVVTGVTQWESPTPDAAPQPPPPPPPPPAVADSPWAEVVDVSSGHKYYHNQVTGETSWSVPLGAVYAEKV